MKYFDQLRIDQIQKIQYTKGYNLMKDKKSHIDIQDINNFIGNKIN